jgi:[protein-PII] uridylyltransferase
VVDDHADAAAKLRAATTALLGRDVPDDEIEAHFTTMPPGYYLHAAPEDAAHHLRMIHRLIASVSAAEPDESLRPIVEWHDDPGSGQSLVTVVTWDRAGLFSRMAGAFAVAGINIASCRAFSREDDVSIDFFKVVLPLGKEPRSKERFTAALEKSLLAGTDLLAEVAAEEQHALLTAPRRKAFVPLAAKVEVYYEFKTWTARSSRSSATTVSACCSASAAPSRKAATPSPSPTSPRSRASPSILST